MNERHACVCVCVCVCACVCVVPTAAAAAAAPAVFPSAYYSVKHTYCSGKRELSARGWKDAHPSSSSEFPIKGETNVLECID